MQGLLRGITKDYSPELNSIRVKIWDVNKKELITTTASISEASKITGIPPKVIRRMMNNKRRSEPSENKLNKLICFR